MFSLTFILKCLNNLFSESLLDDIDCFSGGNLCDVVKILVLPNTGSKSNRTAAKNFPKRRSRTGIRTQSLAPKQRLLFIAFDRVFDVAVKREKGSECFFDGHVIGKKRSSAAFVSLCGGVVSSNPFKIF